jgi:hypothetical protein
LIATRHGEILYHLPFSEFLGATSPKISAFPMRRGEFSAWSGKS